MSVEEIVIKALQIETNNKRKKERERETERKRKKKKKSERRKREVREKKGYKMENANNNALKTIILVIEQTNFPSAVKS